MEPKGALTHDYTQNRLFAAVLQSLGVKENTMNSRCNHIGFDSCSADTCIRNW